MHDIRMIRENPAEFDAQMARRGLSGISSEVLALDEARRAAIAAAEARQAEAKKAAKEVGAAKARGDEAEFERLRALVAGAKQEVARLGDEAKEKDRALTDLLMTLPNIMDADVPAGADEDDNVELRRWGTPRELGFAAREHYELPAVQGGGMDFETAAKLAGSRFVLLSGAVARLHRALAQFMLDTHVTENGLTEVNAPVLVREEMMYGTGQLPKFGEDSYQTREGWWLIPTSEVSLANMANNEILAGDSLPRRYTAHSLCFRSEAGSAGKDTAGMLRQHQFEKVEMVSVTRPKDSAAEQERMTRCAEGILEALNLPYRTVLLCTGDTGFGAQKTYDIEVWLPGQGTYREISSVSNTGAFQARRMNARYRPTPEAKPEFVHLLNGSGVAVGRCLIAVLENGQQEDGSVALPEALAPYLRGATTITATGELV
ncbi:MAG: serine--tRNA ligase [Rhodobacterales bacterium]|nr:MAG: serine--tRNA ligase [Rhodobacterales bacterium]